MHRPDHKLNFEQRQEVEQIMERISAGDAQTLEEELYSLIYARDGYRERAEGVIIDEHLI